MGYIAFAFVAPYYLVRMTLGKKYRAGLRQRLTFFTEEQKQRLKQECFLWIHTVSVGELMAARPLLKRLKTTFPQYKILVTTVTETGQNLARQVEEVDEAIYLPLDLYPLCQKMMDWIRPVCLIILETEMWPNFLRSAMHAQVPFFLVNARLSDKSFRNYFRFRTLFAPLLARFTGILAQSEEDRNRFLQLGTPPEIVQSSGNLKFESVPHPDRGEMRRQWRSRFQLRDDEILLLGGSTFPGEESLLVRVQQTLCQEGIRLRLLLAPRHIERIPSILEELIPFGVPILRRSQYQDGQPIDPRSILLLDTIGELRSVYSAAELVFIGKSICGQGGQNPIEPAAWGCPILFGKNMQNFRDVAALFLRADAARSVADENELLETCRTLSQSPEIRESLGQRARDVVTTNQGTLDRIIATIQPYLRKDLSCQ